MDINMDKIKSGLDKAAVYTVKTTGKVVSVAKLSLKKTELRGKIDDGYKKLGKLIYENSKAEEEDTEIESKLDAIKAELDGYMAELKECNDSIDSYKD